MEAIRGSQKSLILVARQLGVHIGANDIPERFKIDDRELSLKEMCELARSFDLKAKATKVNDELYLHRSCVPIDQVDFGKEDPQLDLFNNECQGMCGN